MQIKGILFGLGLGMVFLSAVFLMVHRFENRGVEHLSEQMIIEQATDLGMVWLTESEIVRKAMELGMIFDE